MAQLEMPMNAAHQHAADADDYLAQGLWISAAESHSKAADAYMAAVERTTDESVKRTLRMLYNDHCKAGKELERKIAKLKEENKDPTLPQKPERAPSPSQANALAGFSQSISSTLPYRAMTDSQNPVDESFMLLGGQRSDPGDAFNRFWTITQGMLDNLSQPVAFATVPLGVAEASASTSRSASPAAHRSLQRDGSLSSDTDIDEPIVSRLTRRIGLSKDYKKHGKPSTNGTSTSKNVQQHVISLQEEDFEEDLSEGDDLSGSFCLIPSGSEPSASSLKKENAALKTELEALQMRLATTERTLQMRKDQDQQLRDSIVLARREAERALGASRVLQRPVMDFNALNPNIPSVTPPIIAIDNGRDAQHTRRIRELEEELRIVRAENEKNKVMIVKFRERWEKLKESAKRKKDAKNAAASTALRERIDEEPEAEQALDDAK